MVKSLGIVYLAVTLILMILPRFSESRKAFYGPLWGGVLIFFGGLFASLELDPKGCGLLMLIGVMVFSFSLGVLRRPAPYEETGELRVRYFSFRLKCAAWIANCCVLGSCFLVFEKFILGIVLMYFSLGPLGLRAFLLEIDRDELIGHFTRLRDLYSGAEKPGSTQGRTEREEG